MIEKNQKIVKDLGRDSEDRVSLGLILNMPEYKLADIISLLESESDVRVIYKKAALYELYITPYPPKCWNRNQGE